MYDTTIAAKLLAQLESFWGRISPHFHKPVARFIGDMLYGIMAGKDVKLSSVVRALREKTTPKKVEDRLSRMLSSDGLEEGLHDAVAAEASDILKRGRRWRGLNPKEAQRRDEMPLFDFFGVNTG